MKRGNSRLLILLYERSIIKCENPEMLNCENLEMKVLARRQTGEFAIFAQVFFDRTKSVVLSKPIFKSSNSLLF